MSGAVALEGWNLDEFATAVGVILFSALVMYALAHTLLINPLHRNRRQFQFYTGQAQLRRDRAVVRNAPVVPAVASEVQRVDAQETGDGDPIVSHEAAEREPGSNSNADGDVAFQRSDTASMARKLDKQRRQVETLEAVNDQLCAENERLEAKLAAVSRILAQR